MSSPGAVRLPALVALAAALFATTWAAIALTREMQAVAAVWPVDAIVTAVLVRWARDGRERIWVLAAAAAATIPPNLIEGSPPALAVLMVAMNLGCVWASYRVVRRFGAPLDGLSAFAAYVAGPMILFPLISGAVVGAAFAVVEPGSDLVMIGMRWFSACSLGMAIVGSFALTVRLPSRAEPLRHWRRFVLGQAVVFAASIAILFLSPWSPLFLLAPLLVLGALSHRELGGVTAVAIVALSAWAATLVGRGPGAVAQLVGMDGIRVVQAFLAAMVFTVLPISALLRRLDAQAAELDERRARAEELNALKTRLLAHVSHEIRSPLSGVTTLAGLMRDGGLGELTAEQRDTLAEIAYTGAEVDQLARDLTDAAAIQTGAATVRIGRVDAADAVRTAVGVARFRADRYGAEIRIGPSASAFVAADPLRLRQILVNLLVNAAKYGGSPPLVSVRTVEAERGMLRFEVADNGPGVPLARRDALFRDFERLGAEKTDLEGSGLGLALSREIARLQDGAMGVGEADQGGALFWLELPLWKASADAEAA